MGFFLTFFLSGCAVNLVLVRASLCGHDKENLTALVLGLGITFVSITATTYFASKSVTSLVTTDGR